jgi:hypothetical protein
VITVQMVREFATGTLAEWIDGYTGPDPDGIEPQRRFRLEEEGDGWAIVRVEGARYTSEEDRRFRIAITVEELT